MKKLILIIATIASFSSQASFFATNCSNATGSVTSSGGHIPSSLVVTKVEYVQNKRVETKINLNYSDVEVSNELESVIAEESNQVCSENSNRGYSTWKTISSKKIILANKDGSEFNKNILGVSIDLKTVEAFLICKLEGNSQILCRK